MAVFSLFTLSLYLFTLLFLLGQTGPLPLWASLTPIMSAAMSDLSIVMVVLSFSPSSHSFPSSPHSLAISNITPHSPSIALSSPSPTLLTFYRSLGVGVTLNQAKYVLAACGASPLAISVCVGLGSVVSAGPAGRLWGAREQMAVTDRNALRQEKGM
ncbi:hypothetical protein JZ751_009476, partial [Albula glossodonta]